MIDEQKYMALLKDCVANGDEEIAHSDADNILCQLLTELGYSEIVGIYSEVDKWYA